MLKYAIILLVLALAAAIAGFSLAASLFADVAKVLFFLFAVAFLYFLIRHFMARRV